MKVVFQNEIIKKQWYDTSVKFKKIEGFKNTQFNYAVKSTSIKSKIVKFTCSYTILQHMKVNIFKAN